MPDTCARPWDRDARDRLVAGGVPAVLARVYAARGVDSTQALQADLPALLPPSSMHRCEEAAGLLADAIARGERLLIVADYDCDGATACALGVRALRALGAQVDYLVPNRFEYGYGLTPPIADLAARRRPDWLITVDNGIAAIEGVARANELGMRVLVTDHHLPGPTLPAAACIVNPNQVGCDFPSKHLAGVGVMLYVLLALRAELRRRDRLPDGGPNLARWLDIVALGTVADVVRLDRNNRILVEQGLRRIRAGHACPGIAALLRAAGRDPARATTYDLGFVAGPRLNAAGRLKDMSIGIECLLAEDAGEADRLAHQLDAMNRERREIEADMREQALAIAAAADAEAQACSLALFQPDWHPGVVGIVAARVKDRLHRPAFCFARAGDGLVKGSGRSIAALHLRDALATIDVREPGLLLAFGGHAAAAGVTLREADLPRFEAALESVASEALSAADLSRVIETDGPLAGERVDLALARTLQQGVWGSGFPQPEFHDGFEVLGQKVVGSGHLRVELLGPHGRFSAMRFGSPDPLPPRIEAVYRLEVNAWQGVESMQLTLSHWRAQGEPQARWA
ncbi:MAG: single-stranded-DNA-specific exonuclease RecJ [Pseudomonadota bacterium]|jgi:single-stranded-DNA-specific exonuclease